MDAERVVCDMGSYRMLEVDVKLVHAGRIVDVCHYLVQGDAHIIVDLLACVGVE